MKNKFLILLTLVACCVFSGCKTNVGPKQRTTDDVVIDITLPEGFTLNSLNWEPWESEGEGYQLFLSVDINLTGLEANRTYFLVNKPLIVWEDTTEYTAGVRDVETDAEGCIKETMSILLLDGYLPESITLKSDDIFVTNEYHHD